MTNLCGIHREYSADCRMCNVSTPEHHPLMTKEEKLAKLQDWSFLSVSGSYSIPGQGLRFSVLCPIDCYGFGWLIGKSVKIDGYAWRVTSVESFAHGHSRRHGEQISLVVEKESL